MTGNARGRLHAALEEAGWTVLDMSALGDSQRGNPVRLDVRRGRIGRHLLVYSWNATPEGAGRKRHDLGIPKYRVQTTRSHEGDLLFPPGRTSLGIGWRADWDVFFAFDLWAKRFTGQSSSVFVEPDFLAAGRGDGTAEEIASDGAQLAFLPSHVDALFAWSDRLAGERRTLPVEADRVDWQDPDHAEVVVDTRRRTRVTWLRPGDYTVLYEGPRRVGNALWQVRATAGERVGAKTNHVMVRLQLQRWGTVRDDDWLRS